MSVVSLSGESIMADDRPAVPAARAGTVKRTRDLAMWAAWQAGVSVHAIAREFKVDRTTVWRRVQLVKRSGLTHGARRVV